MSISKAQAHEPEKAPVKRPSKDSEPDVKDSKDSKEEAERGSMTPVQFEDDGWGDTPVQMRG